MTSLNFSFKNVILSIAFLFLSLSYNCSFLFPFSCKQTTTDNIKRTMTKLCKKFDKMGKDYEAPARVASEMQSEMVTFCRDCNPLLEILCTAGLKERHWTMMNEITSLDIPYMEEEMTLESCLEHGLESCVKDIEETCVNATKEYSLETALDNMVTDWDGLEFGTKAYKDSGKTDVVLFF